MSGLGVLFRESQRIGFTLTALCIFSFLLLGGITAVAVARAPLLWHTPILGLAIEFALFAIVGIGALIGLWLIDDHLDYVRRGYRVRRISGDNWLYEERTSDHTTRSQSFVRTIVGKGYPVPSEVRILGEACWESSAPIWARGRRAEIIRRIAECLGADQGARIIVVDD